MMSAGCCKHVLKVNGKLMDKKMNKKRCIPIYLKVDFLSNALLDSCKLCTVVLRTDRGIKKYGSSKFPLGGSKSVCGSRPISVAVNLRLNVEAIFF